MAGSPTISGWKSTSRTMRRSEVAVTKGGEAMLNDLLAGRRLTVLSAWGGTGETSPEALAELEDLAGERVPLELLDVENGLEGKTVKIQISNTGVEEGYTLHQIGVFAQVDGGPEQLLCVYQDRDQRGRKGGVEVPAQAGCPTFLLEFYGFLKITNGVKFEVDLSRSGAVVTPQYLADVMASHNQDGRAHQDLREAVREAQASAEDAAQAKPETGAEPPGPDTPGQLGQHYFDTESRREYICVGREDDTYIWVLAGAKTAEDVEVEGRPLAQVLAELAAHNTAPQSHPDLRGAQRDMDARLALLELLFNTDVSGNPFTATFETLTGLTAQGVWNTALNRLEF